MSLKGSLKDHLKKRVDKGEAAATLKKGVSKKNVQMRWILVIGALFVGATIVSSNTQRTYEKPKKAEKPEEFLTSNPTVLDLNRDPELKNQAQFQKTQEALNKILEKQQELESKIQELESKPVEVREVSRPPNIVLPPSLDNSGNPTEAEAPKVVIPPPPPGGFNPVKSEPKELPPLDEKDQESSSRKITREDDLLISRPGNGADNGVFKAPPKTKVEQNKTKVIEQANNTLPAGSFASVALLTGLEAGAGTQNQANPEPVLMRIQNHATLPGAAKYKLKSCFILGSGYGDLSSERVKIRAAQISCVDSKRNLVLTSPVQGYIVDSDGKLGLRGEVIDRQGAKLAQATLASFAQGLSGAIGASQGNLTQTPFGDTNSIGGAEALRASGLQAAQNATSQLADFYLKEAAALFPVISIDSTRQGTIVFTGNSTLSWSENGPKFRTEEK